MSHEQIYEQITNITSTSMTVSALEKELLDTLMVQINESLVTSGNSITGVTQPVGKIITKSIKSFYASTAYQKSLANLLRNIDGIGLNKLELYKDADFVLPRAEINKAQTKALDELLDALNDNGLNTEFNQPLRRIIYDNIRRGKSQSALAKTLCEYVESSPLKDSKMKRYINQMSIQGADAYSSAVDNEIMKKYKTRVTHVGVVGSLIDSSSPQCRQAVQKYSRRIPVDKLPEWIAYAKENGGSDNLTQDNLSIIKAHYGCRHQFVPLINP